MTVGFVGRELVQKFTLFVIQYLVMEVGRCVSAGASNMLVKAGGEARLLEGHGSSVPSAFELREYWNGKFTPRTWSDSLKCGFGG